MSVNVVACIIIVSGLETRRPYVVWGEERRLRK